MHVTLSKYTQETQLAVRFCSRGANLVLSLLEMKKRNRKHVPPIALYESAVAVVV
jgi:hypothetical protein